MLLASSLYDMYDRKSKHHLVHKKMYRVPDLALTLTCGVLGCHIQLHLRRPKIRKKKKES